MLKESDEILYDYYSTNLIHSRNTTIADVSITKLNRAVMNKIYRKVVQVAR